MYHSGISQKEREGCQRKERTLYKASQVENCAGEKTLYLKQNGVLQLKGAKELSKFCSLRTRDYQVF